jgi:NADH-ubiquinone oxidoreductase chain 5
LVTAGLVLLINFYFLLLSGFLMLVLSFVGALTMFFSSLISLFEQDIKKVVALRTLSQIGFATLILGLGLGFFSLFHLVRHALFKSCLFIQVGLFIYKSFGQQDRRFYGVLVFVG